MTDARHSMPQIRNAAITLLLAISCTAPLSGCFPILVGAVAMTSYAATDRRPIGAQTDDKVIGVRGADAMDAAFGKAAHINVTSFNRQVLLTGQVLDEESKARAERIVRDIPSVTNVVNALEIGPPTSIGQQSTDAYITTSVKGALVNRSDLFANAYKVVTENGVVYLMGRVTHHEGDYAAEVARGVSGVRSVVKVFDYISDDELKRMQTQSAVPSDNPPPPPPPNSGPNAPAQ